MAKTGYSVTTTASVSLSAATATTVLAVRGNAAFGVDLLWYEVGFNGATSTAVPAVIELCYLTFATNAPGTNSTSRTPVQEYGRVTTHGFTAGSAWTTEPTTITVMHRHQLPVFNGLERFPFPFGQGKDSAFSEGFALRLTAPATVSADATFGFERA